MSRVGKDAVKLDSKLSSYDANETGVSVTVSHVMGEKAGTTTTHTGDVLIAADGIHSMVKKTCPKPQVLLPSVSSDFCCQVRKSFYGDEKPSFTGWIIWRGAMPIERWPADIPLEDVVTYGHSDAYMAWYPFRKDESGKETLVNWGACIKQGEQGDVAESWAQAGNKEEIGAHFGSWPEPCNHIVQNTDKIMKLSIHDRDPVKQWAFGRVLLIGDAAHPMLPFAGQGASSAMEDGMLLAQRLSETPSDVVSALKKVEEERIEHVTKVTVHCRNRGGILEEFVVVDKLKENSDEELKTLLDSKGVEHSDCTDTTSLLLKVLNCKDAWPESFLRKLY